MNSFAFTRFDGAAKPHGVRVTEPWESFCQRFVSPVIYAEKLQLPGYSLATFANDHRSKANVATVTALALDYDAGTTSIDEALALWSRYEGFLHTTWSHSVDRPRFRVLLRISRRITAEEHELILPWVFAQATKAGHAIDAKAKDPSRFWFAAGVAHADAPYSFRALTGTTLEVDVVLAAVRAEQNEQKKRRQPKPASAPRTTPAERKDKYTEAALRKAIDAIAGAPEGARNNVLNKEAFSLAGLVASGELDEGRVREALLDAADVAGLKPAEARKTIESGLRQGSKKPRQVPERSVPVHEAPIVQTALEALEAEEQIETEPSTAPSVATGLFTQLFVSEQFVANRQSDLRFVHERGWICWTGTRWEHDKLRPQFLAKEEIKRLSDQVHRNNEKSVASRIVVQLQKANTITAVLQLAQSDPRFSVRFAQLDADPWVLNCQNGVLDLRAGTLREAQREDLCTKASPVHFDPHAQAPTWRAFLERVLPDPDVRSFVQRLAGYAMTGAIREHVLPIFFGKGRDGKGTFIEALSYVLGDYMHPVPAALLRVQVGEGHPTMQAQLRGVRFAPAQETEKKFQLAEALVKQLTGGDRVTARYMREDFFSFEPTHKIFLATNNKPKINGTDEGIWSRVLLVPWTAFIPEHERDGELKNKLRAEAPGILLWALEGCLAWQREGLQPPESVKVATKDFRQESDAVGRFLEERCTRLDGLRSQATQLYQAFEQWCRDEGEKVESQKAFGMALNEREIERKCINGRQWYVGLGLRAEQSSTPSTSEGAVDDVDRVDHTPVRPHMRTHAHAHTRESRYEGSSTLSTSSTNEDEDAPTYPIRRFLRERCVRSGTETIALLFEHWEAFVENEGIAPGSERMFAEALRGRGLTTSGVLAIGVSLRPGTNLEAPGTPGGVS